MNPNEWLKEILPEAQDWQIEIIVEHIEGIAREAYNTGFEQGMETARQFNEP